jgi:hypothetical protein
MVTFALKVSKNSGRFFFFKDGHEVIELQKPDYVKMLLRFNVNLHVVKRYSAMQHVNQSYVLKLIFFKKGRKIFAEER